MTQSNSKKSAAGDVILESRHLIGLFVVMVVIFGVVFVLGYELGRNQYTQQVHAASVPDETTAAAQPAPIVSTSPMSKQTPSASAKQSGSAADEKADNEGQPATNWDFYKAADSNPAPAHLEQPAKNPPPSAIARSKPAKSGANSPVASSGSAIPSAAISAVKPSAPHNSSAVSAPAKPQSLDAPLMPKGTILLQVAALTKQSDALAMAEALEHKKFPTIVVPPNGDKFYRVQVGPYRNLEAAIAARNALENAGFKSIIKR